MIRNLLERKKKESPGEMAERYMLIAHKMEGKGDLDLAIRYYKSAAELYLKVGLESLAAQAYEKAGELSFRLSRSDEGIKYLKDAYAIYLSNGYDDAASHIQDLISAYGRAFVKESSLKFPNKRLENEWLSVVEKAISLHINIDSYVKSLNAIINDDSIDEEIKIKSIESLISRATNYLTEISGEIDKLKYKLKTGDSYYQKAMRIINTNMLKSLPYIKNARTIYSELLKTGLLTPATENELKNRISELNKWYSTITLIQKVKNIEIEANNILNKIRQDMNPCVLENSLNEMYDEYSAVYDNFERNKNKYFKVNYIEKRLKSIEKLFEKLSVEIENSKRKKEMEERIEEEKRIEEYEVEEKREVEVKEEKIEPIKEEIKRESEEITTKSKEVDLIDKETKVKPVLTYKDVRRIDENILSKKEITESKDTKKMFKIFKRPSLPGKEIKISGPKLQKYLGVAMSYEEKEGLVIYVVLENISDKLIADVVLKFETIGGEILKYISHEPETVALKGEYEFNINRLKPEERIELRIHYDILSYSSFKVDARISAMDPEGHEMYASGKFKPKLRPPSFMGAIPRDKFNSALFKKLMDDVFKVRDRWGEPKPPKFSVREVYMDISALISKDHPFIREYQKEDEYLCWFGRLDAREKYLIKLVVNGAEIKINFGGDNANEIERIKKSIINEYEKLYQKKYKEAGKSVTNVQVHQEIKDAVMYQKESMVNILREE